MMTSLHPRPDPNACVGGGEINSISLGGKVGWGYSIAPCEERVTEGDHFPRKNEINEMIISLPGPSPLPSLSPALPLCSHTRTAKSLIVG